ncbi:MAG: hypothetical protein ACRDHN_19510, partial [Thermomicrobiales bacterium]
MVSALMLGTVAGPSIIPENTASADVTTCPPGPVYSGGVCVPGGASAFGESVTNFTPGTYGNIPHCRINQSGTA